MSRTPKTVELDLESLIDVSIVLNRADETIRKSLTAPDEEGEFQRALDAEVARLPELCSRVWSAEAYAGSIRISNGIPHRVHRIEALGNAVIPQIPQVIGRAILTFDLEAGRLALQDGER